MSQDLAKPFEPPMSDNLVNEKAWTNITKTKIIEKLDVPTVIADHQGAWVEMGVAMDASSTQQSCQGNSVADLPRKERRKAKRKAKRNSAVGKFQSKTRRDAQHYKLAQTKIHGGMQPPRKN